MTWADDRARLPLGLVVFGLISISLLVGSDQVNRRSIVRETSRIGALAEIERDAAVSHLWLEEHVSGDVVDKERLVHGLDHSFYVLAVLLGERRQTPGSPNLQALSDESHLARTAALARRLDAFQQIASQRLAGFEAGLPVGIGSAIDAEYDAVFNDVLSEALALRRSLEREMADGRRRSRLVMLTLVVTWGSLIIIAAAALWNREQHRFQTEQALLASQEQLLQSRKLEAVGRIAGGLAHDINNYLAAIRGHCELVRMKSPAGSRVIKKMDSAIRVVLKASSLIDQLLAFGQAQPVQLEVLDLNQIIDGLEKMLRPTMVEGIRVTQRLDPDLGLVEADLSQLEQILVNLIINARDAMPDGGEMVLETRNSTDPQDAITFTVADTGRGIPAEVRDKIFEPFFTTKVGGGHSGLGLATVYHIVRQNGGEIEVVSEVGRGTRICVALPRSTKTASLPAQTTSENKDGLTGSEKILVVDDNPEFLESTQALLEALGYEVLTATSGEQALEVFEHQAEAIDLVLADVVMPGISGRELVDRLAHDRLAHDRLAQDRLAQDRLTQDRPEIKAILMSGYNEDVVLRHGVEKGEIHFIKKQFSSTSLARLIRDVLADKTA